MCGFENTKRVMIGRQVCIFFGFNLLLFLKASNASEAWIGLHDRSKEGRYVWVDGSTIPFSEWLQGEPNGDTSENCIVQAKGNWTSGWADRRCFERKAFVCEVPVPGK